MTITQDHALQTEPFEPTIGSLVHGIELHRALDDDTVGLVRAALLDRKVLVFPAQHLDPDELERFARYLGEPFHDPDYAYASIAANRYVVALGPYEPGRRPSSWHQGGTWKENPWAFEMLQNNVVPPVGGDTIWADLQAAYDALSAPLARLVDGLRAAHLREVRFDSGAGPAEAPHIDHPLVLTHPETGRKGLYLTSRITHLVGLPRPESEALLAFLQGHASHVTFQFRHRWAGGLASLVGRALGHRWGVAAGFALSIFVVTSVASGITAGTIATTLYSQYSPHSHNVLSNNWLVWAVVFSAAALLFAYVGIRPAVRGLLVMSAIGGAAFLVMIVFVLAKGGVHGIVWSGLIPFSHSVSTREFVLGVGLAFGPFTGMEAATFLGEESVHPKRHIPIATIGVVVVASLFYVLFSLAMVTGYGSSASGQKAYINDGFGSILTISSQYVSPWFGKLLLWIVLIAAFTFTLAIVNEGGRLFYRWGKDGIIGRVFQRTSPRFHTPTVALGLLATIAAAYYLVVYAWKGGSVVNTVEIVTYISLLVTVTVLIAYGFIGVAGAVEGWRSHAHPLVRLVLPVVAVAIILLALYNEFIPAPPSPYGSAPYVGLGVVVVGVVVGLVRVDLRVRRLAARDSSDLLGGVDLRNDGPGVAQASSEASV